MNALVWRDEELGAKWDEVEIPADMADQAASTATTCSRRSPPRTST